MHKVGVLLAAFGVACNSAAPTAQGPVETAAVVQTSLPPDATAALSSTATPVDARPSGAPVSFEDDLTFLKKHGDVIVLTSPSGGKVIVSPKYQGRVMTSAVEAGGRSLGFVFRKFIEAGKTGTQFDNYGGEDRFWIGPEAGQFGFYFPKGKPFTISEWKTPDAFQTGTWEPISSDAQKVVFKRPMKLENYSGATFDLEVTRTVSLLDEKAVETKLGVKPGASVKWVGFETTNRVENTGTNAWNKDTGLLSVWILGMYNPSPDTRVVIPFEKGGQGDIVNDKYFGKVPAERLEIDEKLGVVFFKCDGQERGKIGIGPKRAKSVAGSYSVSAKLLTIVHYDFPKRGNYVNSMWEQQKDPYAGDVVNSYNDGPTEPGKPSLGGFYEIESSSPALALKPKVAVAHAHRTYHFVGEPADLDPIAKKVLGVTIADITAP